MDSIIKTGTPALDISLGKLLASITSTPDLPIVFTYEGREIKGGYHVTEVKAGQFSALDCEPIPKRGLKFSCSYGISTKMIEPI